MSQERLTSAVRPTARETPIAGASSCRCYFASGWRFAALRLPLTVAQTSKRELVNMVCAVKSVGLWGTHGGIRRLLALTVVRFRPGRVR